MSPINPLPHSPAVTLACELIRAPSVTPEDHGAQAVLIARLEALGFEVHDLTFGPVRNFFARLGSLSPHLCFAGHTDVVPPGPEDDWSAAPFGAEIVDDILIGRGAADMKGALAAMVVAVERYLQKHPRPSGSISFLITGDEEADAVDGTVRMVPWLKAQNHLPDFCLVGEPSSAHEVGDTIKNGRRGSINAALTIHGIQGHVAFPDAAENPIHRAAPALDELTKLSLDQGDEHFPPTRLQLTNIHSGEGASNVIPGSLHSTFNLRFSPQSSPKSIDVAVREVLDRHQLRYDLEWTLSGMPFITAPGTLTDAMVAAVKTVTGQEPMLSTGGGTSDARFIAPAGVAVAELGLINATIHKVDECATLADIDTLTDIYEQLLSQLIAH